MRPTERRPAAPHSRHKECVFLRPSLLASAGNTNEKAKQTAEYIAKQTPPHLTPAVYSGEAVLCAPNTLRAMATPKYSHMQNNPSHVINWTGASCFMVLGMLEMASRISLAFSPIPRF